MRCTICAERIGTTACAHWEPEPALVAAGLPSVGATTPPPPPAGPIGAGGVPGPPGWFADPYGAPETFRYWTGSEWTAETFVDSVPVRRSGVRDRLAGTASDAVAAVRRRPRRTALLGGAAAAVAVAAVALWPSSGAVDVEYRLTLADQRCDNVMPWYFDVGLGTGVRVTDAQGRELGSGKLSAGEDTPEGCVFTDTFPVTEAATGDYYVTTGNVFGSNDQFQADDIDGGGVAVEATLD